MNMKMCKRIFEVSRTIYYTLGEGWTLMIKETVPEENVFCYESYLRHDMYCDYRFVVGSSYEKRALSTFKSLALSCLDFYGIYHRYIDEIFDDDDKESAHEIIRKRGEV